MLNRPFPFKDEEFDFVLLCDILEHVKDPVKLMREAGCVGKNVFLKIPVENAILVRLMHKLRKVKYGPEHPSGHLHCWKLKDVHRIIDDAGLEIKKSIFIPILKQIVEKKYFLKTIVLTIIDIIDFVTPNHFISRNLVGGSLFAIAAAKKK